MISEVLRDFPFSRNQPLKSAGDQYIRILENELIPFWRKQEDRTLWLSHGTCSYIRVYINAVAGSVKLFLQHGFYNIIFKIKHKLYIPSGSATSPPPRSEKFRVRIRLNLHDIISKLHTAAPCGTAYEHIIRNLVANTANNFPIWVYLCVCIRVCSWCQRGCEIPSVTKVAKYVSFLVHDVTPWFL
jgi:hypothetical protein